MRAVLQRVKSAAVSIDDVVVSEIGYGFLILLGVEKGDSQPDAQYIADKSALIRVFKDPDLKMNRSLLDLETVGEVLLISNFTLCGDARKGRRPSFDQAALPNEAETLYNDCAQRLREHGIPVKMGVFGADMAVSLLNDGPVTIFLDSRKRL